MHILLFSSLYPNAINPRHGIFVERRLKKLIEFSKEMKVVVVSPVPVNVFGVRLDNKIQKHEIYNNIEIYRPRFFTAPLLGRYINPLSMFLSSIFVVRKLKKLSFSLDLIDAHYFFPDGVAAVLIGCFYRIPVIITARGSDINFFPGYIVARRYIEWAIKKASAIITVSSALKRKTIELGALKEKVTVLHNGVDLNVYYLMNKDVAKAHININGKILLTVGNLVSEKRQSLIISALPYLPEYRLVVIGEGVLEKSLKLLAADLNVHDRVTFLSRKKQDELVEYYNAADCFILPSLREGLPNVLLESLACGTPLIASNVGGIPEIIRSEDTGFMFDGKKPQATEISDLVKRMEEKNIDRQALRSVAETFSWDNASKGQCDIFTEAYRKFNEK